MHTSTRLLTGLCAVASLGALTHAARAAASFTPVIFSGAPIPQLGGNHTLLDAWDNATLNDAGDVAFLGFVVDGIPTHAIFAGRPGAMTLVAHEGDPAPGTEPGTLYDYPFGNLVMDAAGRVTYLAALQGPQVTPELRQAFYTGAPAAPALLARTGFPAAGLTPDVQYEQFPGDLLAAGPGRVLYAGALRTLGQFADEDRAIWARAETGVALQARAGAGLPGDPQVHMLGPIAGDLNAAGQAVLTTQLDRTFRWIFIDRDVQSEAILASAAPTAPSAAGTLVTVARSGDQAPGLDEDLTFTIFDHPPIINDAGVVGFVGRIQDSAQLGRVQFNSTDSGIWVGTPGNLRSVARAGAQAPDLPAGITLRTPGLLQLSRDGRLAFRATLAGPGVNLENTTVIYTGSPEAPRLLARQGDPAPDTAEGITFYALGTPAMGPAGHVMFRAYVAGLGVNTGFDDQGIWGTDSAGRLRLILRLGDTVEVGPGDSRTVTGATLPSDGPWGPAHGRAFINAQGQYLIELHFSDGASGLFVGQLPAGCAADFDNTNGVQVADIFAFLRAWFANQPSADFDQQNGIQVADIFAFLRAWFAGCP